MKIYAKILSLKKKKRQTIFNGCRIGGKINHLSALTGSG